MAVLSGVIDLATGDLLRAGYTDFSADGSFNPVVEAIRIDIPNPYYPKDVHAPSGAQFHRWDGTQWILISQPVLYNDVYSILELNSNRKVVKKSLYESYNTNTNTFEKLKKEFLYTYQADGRTLDRIETKMYDSLGQQVGTTVVEEYFMHGKDLVVKTTEQ